jgi:hypothetical protein
MSLSKKTRFEVFKRDGFKCAYCGKAPPDVTLEVDHINPKSRGGKDDLNNYITACFDCNRGKKHIPLDKIPNQISLNLGILKEQQSQLNEYNKFIKKLNAKKMKNALEISTVFNQYYSDQSLTDNFIKSSLINILEKLPKEIAIEAMHKACSKIKDPENAVKYFCGICWNIIKGKGQL